MNMYSIAVTLIKPFVILNVDFFNRNAAVVVVACIECKQAICVSLFHGPSICTKNKLMAHPN
jgi:hypothetical protein